MLGMIKKDLFMVKNNYKTIIVAIALYVSYTIMFEIDMSFLLPFMSLMICISTFNYDDFNNWHSFATTLPQGKVNVVKSKYIITIGIIVVATLISILFGIIINNIQGSVKVDELLSYIIGELLAIIFIMSVLYPIIFKFGAEKGKLAMTILGFIIFGVVILLKKIVKIDVSMDLIKFVTDYIYIIFIVVSIILISISYLISKRIYLKREF